MTAQHQLFRQEALEFQRHVRHSGSVAQLEPLSLKLTAWFLVGVLIMIIGFMAVAGYARKETAVGYLTPKAGTAKIFAPHRGTIKDVLVHQGDLVRAGQPLITVETDQIAEDGIDVNVRMLETLAAQKELLSKNIKAEEQRAGSERDRLTSLVRGLETEISQLESQRRLQSERVSIAQSDLAAADQLKSKGFMSKLDYKRREVQVLEQQQAMSALDEQLAARQSKLTESRYTLRQLPTVMAQKVQALRNELATIEQRIAEVNGRRAYVLRAPTAGRVSTVQATVGQSADPQRLQMEIIPEDEVLQAELFIPARAIGFVHRGQPVRILYDAFPYQQFGTYRGRISRVSQTLLTGSDAAGPIALKQPAYRITVALDRQQIDADGKKVALQPDMLLRADIILEKRSLLSWLTSPVRGIRM